MPAEPLETAARIFRAEALDGYRDRVVIGGLAGFVEKLHSSYGSDDVTRVADLLKEYAALAPNDRAARLTEAHSLLTRGEPPPSRVKDPPAASVAAPPPPSARKASPSPVGATLATPIHDLKGVGPIRARLYTR
ncbi:MAG: hypothetical protein LC797_06390, partial [Chloroflexi bacterium]|nr:hypothetical protein [Chloroflexota bacterium]